MNITGIFDWIFKIFLWVALILILPIFYVLSVEFIPWLRHLREAPSGFRIKVFWRGAGPATAMCVLFNLLVSDLFNLSKAPAIVLIVAFVVYVLVSGLVRRIRLFVGDRRPFALMLRTFKDTPIKETVPMQLEHFGPGGHRTAGVFRKRSLLEELSRSLSGWGRLVQIQDDMGRYLTQHHSCIVNAENTEWVQLFKILAEKAAVIFIFPGTTKGLLWELNQLHNSSHLHKTLLVMPPAVPLPTADDKRNESELTEAWIDLQKQLCDRGIQLPNYESDGRFLVLDNSLKPIRVFQCGKSFEKKFDVWFSDFTKGLGAEAAPQSFNDGLLFLQRSGYEASLFDKVVRGRFLFRKRLQK